MSSIEGTVALRRLADVYCTAVDDGDADLMGSLFVPEGELVVYEPGARPGHGEPLRRWDVDGSHRLIAVWGDSYLRWVHFLRSHWTEIDGDRAPGQAYLQACHLRERDGAMEEEVAIIRYRDSYVRMPEGWRFVQRNACRQWTTVRPVSTGQHDIDAAIHGRRDA
jgi:hypothetical protein